MAYDPYWRTLRQVVASMAGLAPTDLPVTAPDPSTSIEAEVRTPEPAPEEGGDADALAS
jgi:hypothetical protein